MRETLPDDAAFRRAAADGRTEALVTITARLCRPGYADDDVRILGATWLGVAAAYGIERANK